MKHPLLSRLRRPAPSRHAAFAAGLRRGASPARVTPVVRALRRLRAWTRVLLRSVQVRTELAPPSGALVVQVDVHPVARTLLQTHRDSSTRATQLRETLLLQRTVARLRSISRSIVRVERTLRETPATPPQRLPMTLARGPAPVPRADAPAPRGQAEPPTPERARSTAWPSAAARAESALKLPAQELSRVTEHVIRQLDQRVLSYRERTGRI